MEEKFIGPREVAELTGLPISWIYSKSEAGVLPSFKVGRYVKFRPSEVVQWLEAQRRDAVTR